MTQSKGEQRLRIGPLKERQVETVARLRHDAFFKGTGRTVEEDAEGLRQLLGDGGYEIALAAEIDGVVVGSCLFVRNEIDPAHDVGPWLAGLVVAEPFRGRGIGRRLVLAIEAHCAALACETINLYTHDAEAFYSALGWQVADRFLDQGETMVLMSKRLEEREKAGWQRSPG